MILITDILGRIESLRQEGGYRHEQNVSAVAAKIASLMGLENGRGTAVGAAALLPISSLCRPTPFSTSPATCRARKMR